ncbi:hypothetical protein FRC10_003135 [Ceratobasidium sp. 414]|nr:hypothetical protein FRC10_003135 [Ceratobasidium sp. 414]
MDDDLWKDPGRQMQAQIMLQQLYKIMERRGATEKDQDPSDSGEPVQHPEDGKVVQEPEVIGEDKKQDEPGPGCDAEDIFKRLRAEEEVDVSTWRNDHMRLFEQHPKQHRNCHRVVWRIVDVLEQRNQNPDEIILLMRDVYQLSARHTFNHLNSGHKLVELLISRAGSCLATAVADLTEAVSIRRNILLLGGPDAEAGYLSRLVNALGLSFHKTSNLDVLREKISLVRQLLFLNPGGSRDIQTLSSSLLELYDRTSEPDILYEMEAIREEQVQRQDQTAFCAVLYQMESEFKEHFAVQDVELCVAQHMSLVQASPSSHATCPERLVSLVEEMKAKDAKPGDLLVIAREVVGLVNRGIGISNQLKALNTWRSLIVSADPDRESNALLLLIRRMHSLVSPSDYRVSDLSWLGAGSPPAKSGPRQDSTDYGRVALVFDAIAQIESDRMPALQWINPMLAMANDHARPPELMEDYADFFRRNAIRSGNFDNMPENSPQRAQSLTLHAMAILANNQPDQADIVVAMLRDALRNWNLPLDRPIPPGHPMRRTLGGLGHALYMRHWWFGKAEDIEAATEVLKGCMAGATDEADYLPHLGALCAALEARYRRLGNVKDIEDACALAHRLLQKIPKVETLQVVALRAAGKAADCLFDATGGITLLDHAASLVRHALRLASAEHPLMPVLMSLLGSILRKRFMHLLMPNDLAASEHLTKVAVSVQEGHGSVDQDLPNNRAMYAETMLVKFEQDPRPEYIDKALSTFQLILDQGGEEDASRADENYRLGNALRIRNRGDDIINAIHHLRKTLLIQPDTRHSRYPIWATALSAALLVEFTQTKNHSIIEEALKLSELAVSLVPDKSTILADSYAQLGEVQYAIFKSQGRAENLERCLLAFQTAASSPSSPHPQCLKYTRRWENIALKHNHPSLWGALDTSLSHQTRLASIGRTVKARHEYLAKDPIPASRAAARAIRQGNLERAVEYLEQGRSVLWRQTLELRSSLESLHNVSPSLADQLGAVVKELDGNAGIQSVSVYSSSVWGVQDPDRILRYNRELAEQYESLLSQIRKLDGFEDFLRPFKFSDTEGVSSDGPVVVVNLCDEACDALVLLESGIHHVPLPADFDELTMIRSNVLTAAARVMYDKGSEMDSILPSVLRLLWASVVEPILDFFESRGTVPKRVFWCIAGLSDLPIHAAGPYKSGGINLPDILISSYTPTVSALIRARQAKAKSSLDKPRVLAVAQTEVGGFSPLPYATEEVLAMKQLEIVSTELLDQEATPHSVLNHLKSHSWAHLCCHGTTNAQLPLLSAFHLHHGPLTIESLMRTELPSADFAFLSACHSAEGSVVQNESMSLASAIQVAGFRSIVATMYAIGDDDGPVVARTLYEYLFRDQTGTVDSSEAAIGLNKAIRVLRKAKVPMHRWDIMETDFYGVV